ncbi:DNA/RNA helicase domain-containing protein [Streptomyces xiamenensis]|uniref:DNA/RNA helicase domain-containing protein n=1 Tax=Streptomyces TaxID=1883 RepID=UPI0006946BF5|nr:DNA/RNA helicase domain-containing protein [Streptomyces sp. NRRL F-2890]
MSTSISGGSRAYEYWALRLLGLKLGGPIPWQPQDDDAYTLRVADSPNQTEAHLRAQSDAGYTACMTAGFC